MDAYLTSIVEAAYQTFGWFALPVMLTAIWSAVLIPGYLAYKAYKFWR